jgi:hypothetical protein
MLLIRPSPDCEYGFHYVRVGLGFFVVPWLCFSPVALRISLIIWGKRQPKQ